MRTLISVLFTLLSFVHSGIAANKWALLVGVSHYPKAYGWNDLAADNDLLIVNDVLKKQGFAEERTTILSNEKATKANIMAAFKVLSQKIQKGDVVVFLFSGHGQRIADQPPLDESDGYDEAIVPYDAPAIYEKEQNEGSRHILDDELWQLFADWRCQLGTSGQLVTFFDACYAGTATRSTASRLERGPLSILAEKSYIEQMRGKPADVNYQETAAILTCDKANWAAMISFFATMPDEMSRQIQDENGTIYGALCYAFAQNLPKMKSDASFRVLLNRIAATMARLVPFQHPTAEGDLDVPIFNFGVVTQKRYFEVVKINAADAVSVNIGALGGLGIGSTMAFYAAEIGDTTGIKPLATGKIVEIMPHLSIILLEKPLLEAPILRGSKVFVKDWVRQGVSAKVQFSTTDLAIKKTLTEKIQFVEKADADLILDVKTTANNKWIWSLNVPQGLIYDTGTAASRADLTEQVICRVRAFEQGRFLREWTEEEETLNVEVELLPCSVKNKAFEKLLDNRPKTTPQQFRIGENFVFKITNRSKLPVYVQIIDIEPSNSLSPAVPTKSTEPNDPIGAGKEIVLKNYVKEVADPTGNEILKVIVSTYPMTDMFSTIPFKDSQTPCLLRGATGGNDIQKWLKPRQQALRSATLPDLIMVKTVHFVIQE